MNTRNGGQWTEGRFKTFITSALRQAFRKWNPKTVVVNEALVCRKLNRKTGRVAQHFKCAACKKAYPRRSIQVDHRIPIGSCKTWDEFIERLFCEKDNLQVLCKKCHKAKTKEEQSGR